MPCGLGGAMPVIIDTTVWIDFFRGVKTGQTEMLEVVVSRGDAALGDLIVSEVLQGVDTDREFRSLKRHFSDAPKVSRFVRPWIAGSRLSALNGVFLFFRTIAISIRSGNTSA